MYKKLFLLIVAGLFLTFLLHAQIELDWAKGQGYPFGDDYGNSVVQDGYGNAYAVGRVLTNKSFISKVDSFGNFVWQKQLVPQTGGQMIDAKVITIDTVGNLYITGYFRGTVDFNPGVGVFNLYASVDYAIFILKLDSAGNFVWAKRIGGTGDYGRSIAVDDVGNVYTTGHFADNTDFDPGPGYSSLINKGYSDIFVLKLDKNGNFIWAKSMGGNNSDYGYGIDVDKNGNVYTFGVFYGTADFDPGSSIYNLTTLTNYFEIFVSKLDSSGNFKWAKKIDVNGSIDVTGNYDTFKVDDVGNVYLSGDFFGTVDLDPGIGLYSVTSIGTDAFFLKLDVNGNFVWAKVIESLNTTTQITHLFIDIDIFGNIYTAGNFIGSIDADPGIGVVNLVSDGTSFISKYNSLGDFIFSKPISPSGVHDMSIDRLNTICLTGSFKDTTNFDPNNVFNLISEGESDAYISKYIDNLTIGIIENKSIFFDVYPNPTRNILYIVLSEKQSFQLYIYSIEDKLVESIAIKGNTLLDVSKYRGGMYFIKAMDNEGKVYQSKFVKE